MIQTTDFISELVAAANMIELIRPSERQRLIERGVLIVKAQQDLLHVSGNTIAIEPAFMRDMPKLADMAGRDEVAELVVGAGMLMLAGEMRRLRILIQSVQEA